MIAPSEVNVVQGVLFQTFTFSFPLLLFNEATQNLIELCHGKDSALLKHKLPSGICVLIRQRQDMGSILLIPTPDCKLIKSMEDLPQAQGGPFENIAAL